MLKMQQINITQEFNAPVEKVFAILSEHENLNKLFAPAKVTRLSDGQDARNGVGSARKLSIPLTPSFVETNLVYRENELIEYAITSGIAPIKAHRGVMKFTDWEIIVVVWTIRLALRVVCLLLGQLSNWHYKMV